jgi:type II secretory pathway predicted ATPase ExeA
MYENFYGFKERPFSLLPDPSYFYYSKQHSAALTMFEYGLHNQAGFTVITGGIGCGKTTLVHYLIERLQSDISLGLITNTHESFGDLLQWVLLAFGLEYSERKKIDRYQTLNSFLIQEHQNNRRCILVIDEAQNLGPQVLEELRMLSNVNVGKNQLLQIVLLGQPELLEILRRPDLYQLAQRIVADYFIGPLSLDETRAYIRHRIAVAGGTPPLFTDTACDAVYRFSKKGVPRLINLICDTSLVYGYGAQEKTINEDIVHEVLRDKTDGRRIWRRRKYHRKMRGPELVINDRALRKSED